MTSMIRVFLSQPQLNKLKNGKGFQLSYPQLAASSGKHHIQIHLANPHYNQVLRNCKNGKGFRFSPEKIQGAGFWDSAKGAASSLWNNGGKQLASDLSKKAIDYGKNMASNYAKEKLNDLADKHLGSYSGIAKDLGNNLIDQGIDAAGDTAGNYIDNRLQGSGIRSRGRPSKKFGGTVMFNPLTGKTTTVNNFIIPKIRPMSEYNGNGNNIPTGVHNGDGILSDVLSSVGLGIKNQKRGKKGKGFSFHDLMNNIRDASDAGESVMKLVGGAPQFAEMGAGMRQGRQKRGCGTTFGNNTGETLEPFTRLKAGRKAGGYAKLVGGVPTPIKSSVTTTAMRKYGRENALVGNQIYSGSGMMGHPSIGIPAEKLVRGGSFLAI